MKIFGEKKKKKITEVIGDIAIDLKKPPEQQQSERPMVTDTEKILGLFQELPKLAPKLVERKEILEKDIHRLQGEIAETDGLAIKLDEKKKQLHQEIKDRQRQMKEIDEVESIVRNGWPKEADAE